MRLVILPSRPLRPMSEGTMTERRKKETAVTNGYPLEDTEGGLIEGDDPVRLFQDWLAQAEEKELNDPNAMTLATVDEAGMPDARIVLLKGFDERGFVFYTNTLSIKGRQLASTSKAALTFHWKSLGRQVRVRGLVAPVESDQADAYFATRPRGSQIGAWASQQSEPMAGRDVFLAEIARYEAEFDGGDVPRPPHWSGYRVTPLRVEFWLGHGYRLHDRLAFERAGAEDGWTCGRLFP